MSERERDSVIERVRATLRADAAAAPSPQAVGRLLQAVWASPRPSWWSRSWDAWRVPALSGLGASAVAVVALALGFVTRGAVTTATPPAPIAASGSPTGEFPVQLASDDGEMRVPTQFVYEAGSAERVSVVGDFNDWKVGEVEMQRVGAGMWTATVPLPPGRHVYAYVIDGTLLVADPRAPKSGDADYGREDPS